VEYEEGKITVFLRGRTWATYDLIQDDVCKKCSYPLTSGRCIRTSVHSPRIAKTYTIGLYYKSEKRTSDDLSKHIRNLKEYKDKAEPLGLAIAELIRNRDKELLQSELLVPVPQHKDGMKTDRPSGEEFNQAKELAEWISSVLSIPVAKVLIKTRDESSHELDCTDREKRSAGLYECISTDVEGKSVLLIDDVNTCGVTLKRCAEELSRAGAREIRAYVCGITHLD